MVKRLWNGYWRAIMLPIAIASSLLTAFALAIMWRLFLGMPAAAAEIGTSATRIAIVTRLGYVVFVALTLFSVYWCISMFVAANHNAKMQGGRRQ